MNKKTSSLSQELKHFDFIRSLYALSGAKHIISSSYSNFGFSHFHQRETSIVVGILKKTNCHNIDILNDLICKSVEYGLRQGILTLLDSKKERQLYGTEDNHKFEFDIGYNRLNQIIVFNCYASLIDNKTSSLHRVDLDIAIANLATCLNLPLTQFNTHPLPVKNIPNHFNSKEKFFLVNKTGSNPNDTFKNVGVYGMFSKRRKNIHETKFNKRGLNNHT